MTVFENMPFVDTHAHVFGRGLRLAPQRRYAPDYDARLPDYLALLDACGIRHGVLVQPSFLGTDNSYLLHALRSRRDRLKGVVVVEPQVAAGTLRRMRDAGVTGIRLNLIGEALPDLGGETYAALLGKVAALGWHVELHCAAQALPLLLPPLLKSGVDVVLDHFGRPDPRLGVDDPGFRYLLAAAAGKPIWVKLSGAYRNGNGAPRALAHALLDAVGPAHLMWGSDWPHTQFEGQVDFASAFAQLTSWIPDAAARSQILSDTPARLFRFASQ